MPDEELTTWYKRVMCDNQPIPEGITLNNDGRAEQNCTWNGDYTCDEIVDATGFPFSATRCHIHLDADS